MKIRHRLFPVNTAVRAPLLAALLGFAALPAAATEVTMTTDFGDIRVDLFEDEAPVTVANFLNYLRSDRYEDSIIHRSVPGFVIQGGGFRIINTEDGERLTDIATDAAIQNEPGISNTRGTIAMAKIGGDPNSATSQWFFNIDDNTGLDTDNGGFTVFGRVDDASLAILDQINGLPRVNTGLTGLGEVPVVDFQPGNQLQIENFVRLSIVEDGDPDPAGFQINAGLNDAWFNPDTDGQGVLFTIFPTSGVMFMAWFTFDAERPDETATAILGEPGHRWITAQGAFSGDSASLSAVLTSGGVFDASEPAVDTNATYGTIDVVFTNCNAAEITYDFPDQGLSGVVPLERVVLDNVALCEELAVAPPVQ